MTEITLPSSDLSITAMKTVGFANEDVYHPRIAT
jgi:hypothetical protein